MLETTSGVLLVLWLVGLVISYTAGGYIHILLVFAVMVILIRVIPGQLCNDPGIVRRHLPLEPPRILATRLLVFAFSQFVISNLKI